MATVLPTVGRRAPKAGFFVRILLPTAGNTVDITTPCYTQYPMNVRRFCHRNTRTAAGAQLDSSPRKELM